MRISNASRKALRSFAAIVVQESKYPTDFHPGPWLAIPKNLLSEAIQAGFDPRTCLTFDTQEIVAVYEARNALRSDPALDHLSGSDIHGYIQEFAWQVKIDQVRTSKAESRHSVTKRFIEYLEAPIQEYTILHVITELEVSDDPWMIGKVTIRRASQQDVDRWHSDKRNWTQKIVVGSTISICSVIAGSPQVAERKAAVMVDEALDVIRLSVAQFGFRIWDNELRFHRLPKYYAMRKGDEAATFTSSSYSNRRHSLPLKNGELSEFCKRNMELISAIWGNRIQSGLRDDFVRSIRWIGKSIANDDMDQKVIGLCTALECLLSDRSSGLKSIDICRRTMSLGELTEQGFLHPATIIDLYNLRSLVVHGSRFGISDEGDYRALLEVAIDIVKQALHIVISNARITTKKHLFQILDHPTRLTPCLEWCERNNHPAFEDLIKDLKSRIDDHPLPDQPAAFA